MAERVLWAAVVEQAQAERDIMANRICELRVNAAISDRELGVIKFDSIHWWEAHTSGRPGCGGAVPSYFVHYSSAI